MKRFTLISATLLSTGAFAAMAAMSQPSMETGSSVERRERTEYRADLESPKTLASGNARYRSESRGPAVRVRFDVSIEDADPDTTYDVMLNGAVIGTITTDGLGMGEVTFRSPSDDPDDIPNTPSISAGDVVSVGPISGVLS